MSDAPLTVSAIFVSPLCVTAGTVNAIPGDLDGPVGLIGVLTPAEGAPPVLFRKG